MQLSTKQKEGGGGGGGGVKGASGIFLGKMGPQVATSWGEKNVKRPYLDNRFQNYVIHSPLGKGNSKSLDFPLLSLAKFI